jgi:AraC-like DNA-binding protein
MTREQLEGADGRRSFVYRQEGEPFTGLELHLDASDLPQVPPMPGLLDLDTAAWDAAARAGTLSRSNDEAVLDGLRELLRRLAELGLLAQDAADKALTTPRPLVRLWGAVRPMIERSMLAPKLDDMSGATGLPVSQVRRDVGRLIGALGLVGPGLRNSAHHLRLKFAVLFLSAAGASVTDVAGAVGYGSVDAMALAFRLAGLPAPSVVQRDLLAARAALSAEATLDRPADG